ncbi:MXAN_6640 family putative metalloprotease [Marmoricola sp. URHA0025 HA25]
MRSPLRTASIAGVAVALVLSLPTVAAARPRTPDRGRSTGYTHAQARAVLERVQRAVTRKPAARPAPATDLTLQLRDLRRALPALDSAERTLALGLIGMTVPGPSGSCAGVLLGPAVITSAHFCVHYSNGNTAWAQTTSDTLEHVWIVEVDGLGFRAPLPDADGLFDVYLQEIGNQGYYGACAPAQSSRHSTSSCVLDDDFDPAEFGGAAAINSLSVTAAHEFFHAVQFGYDTDEDTWLMEGSAVWAEEQVYPQINDYLQYVRLSAITHPETSEDYAGANSSDLFYRYGAVLFWKFLSGQLGGPAIVRRVWEYADGDYYSLQAVAAALAERGWSFGRAFARFGVWNTLPATSYDDRALYPPPAWWEVQGLSRRHRTTGTQSVVLDHLANADMLIQPSGRLPRHTKLRVRVDGPALSGVPQASVQVRRRNGTVRVVEVPLDAAGDGVVRVRFDRRTVSSVVVTLTNASTRMTGCGTDPGYLYSCGGHSTDDGLRFSVSAKVRLPVS